MRKIDLVRRSVHMRDVLDIGFIQHNWKMHEKDTWLHNMIRGESLSVTGMDYLKEDIIKLQELGYDCVYCSAEDFQLNKKFDIIFAGDLIEHLFNIGSFLDSSKKHMTKYSELILTTPNAFSIGNLFRIFKQVFGIVNQDNKEHTHWYDKQTLTQTLERKGFEVIEILTISPDRYPNWLDSLIPNHMKSKLFVRAKVQR